jgi:aryl-alcohol dehydrogenase-like predicted oxidoreductase
MTIPTQVLGRTGTEVSALGYGAMELRGQLTGPASQLSGPAITNKDAGRLLNELLDAGVNLIDTSVDYGRSEELIGRNLSSRRSEFFLASKCGCPVSLPSDAVTIGQHDYGAANVRADVEQSLRRLQTDYLDLVQVHLSPPRGEMEASGTIEALQSLRAEGKVRFIGMSGTLPNLPDHIAMGVFDVFQIPYSVLQPEHDELITRAADAGAGVLIRGGVARGTASEDKNWTVQPLSSSGPPGSGPLAGSQTR